MKLSIEQVEQGGGYDVIYADVAWPYNRKAGKGIAEDHYMCMDDKLPMKEREQMILRMPIERIAAKDCALFFWATWPRLPLAMETIQAWGFKFKTLGFLWVKTNSKAGSIFWGTGSYTRANSEPCLLAVRGNPRRVDKGVHQLVETWDPDFDDAFVKAHQTEHSAKPREVRDRIVRLMGADTTKIELFAREKVEGWDCWGNEVESSVDLINEVKKS